MERGQATGRRDCAAAQAPRSQEDRARRLRRLIDVAAIQGRFGLPQDRARLLTWSEQVRGPVKRVARVEGVASRTIRVAEPEPDLRLRRERFRLVLLRQAYRLDYWLPPEAIVNVRRIDRDKAGAWLLLTLWSGAQLLDTGDRITVRGKADDVAISELVSCVQRRSWASVVVTGDDEFRANASRELLARGIEVEDCPLSWDEQERLREQFRAETEMAPARVAEPQAAIGFRI
nr:LPD7 domain-containing protein [Roseococcus sp. SDR]